MRKNEGKEELYAVLGIDSNQADAEYLYRPVGPDQPDEVFQKRIPSARIMCPNVLKCNISLEGKCLVIIGASESRSAYPLFIGEDKRAAGIPGPPPPNAYSGRVSG